MRISKLIFSVFSKDQLFYKLQTEPITLVLFFLLSSFSQEAGRRALWSVNGPRILQVGYEDEEDPKVMEAYESIGSLVSLNCPWILFI